ncbi:MAG: ERF family protein [Sarcina sp.]
MGVYLGQKIVEMRKRISEMDLKKSGENSYSGFNYFELADILPAIIDLSVEYKVFNKVDFQGDVATLTIINNENSDEQFVFTSTVAESKIKGCNDIQNLGGAQTYLRRYLYMNAYEITENDDFDAKVGAKEAKENVLRIYNLGGQAGLSIETIDKQIKARFKTTAAKLLVENSEQVIAGYEGMINQKGGAKNDK